MHLSLLFFCDLKTLAHTEIYFTLVYRSIHVLLFYFQWFSYMASGIFGSVALFAIIRKLVNFSANFGPNTLPWGMPVVTCNAQLLNTLHGKGFTEQEQNTVIKLITKFIPRKFVKPG